MYMYMISIHDVLYNIISPYIFEIHPAIAPGPAGIILSVYESNICILVMLRLIRDYYTMLLYIV